MLLCVYFIQVDYTDAEGHLLADTLCYAQSFKPEAIVDVVTLIDVPLGSAVTPGNVVTAMNRKNIEVEFNC